MVKEKLTKRLEDQDNDYIEIRKRENSKCDNTSAGNEGSKNIIINGNTYTIRGNESSLRKKPVCKGKQSKEKNYGLCLRQRNSKGIVPTKASVKQIPEMAESETTTETSSTASESESESGSESDEEQKDSLSLVNGPFIVRDGKVISINESNSESKKLGTNRQTESVLHVTAALVLTKFNNPVNNEDTKNKDDSCSSSDTDSSSNDSKRKVDLQQSEDETWKPRISAAEAKRRRSLYSKKDKASNKHENKPFKCDICHKGFYKQLLLRRHKRGYHARPFACSVCSAKFKHEPSLREHKKVHESTPKEKPTKVVKKQRVNKLNVTSCCLCNKQFQSNSIYRQHLKVRHDREHLCQICGRVFKFEASFREHLDTHNLQRDCVCIICNREFSDYGCHHCNRRLRTPLDQSLHTVLHICGNVYECPICGVPFNTKSGLEKHSEIHTNYPLCGCIICSKCIDNNDTMYHHLYSAH